MSGAMREKDSADYDLERLTELFDEALTSDDPRVKNALRQLMMMVILTSEDHEDKDRGLYGRRGPMRRMQEDLNDLRRTVADLKHEMQTLQKQAAWGNGYRAADNTSGFRAQSGPDAVSARDFWAQQSIIGTIDPKSLDAQISDDDLRGLNIAIAPATKGLFK
jgi:hypothetical protein